MEIYFQARLYDDISLELSLLRDNHARLKIATCEFLVKLLQPVIDMNSNLYLVFIALVTD